MQEKNRKLKEMETHKRYNSLLKKSFSSLTVHQLNIIS